MSTLLKTTRTASLGDFTFYTLGDKLVGLGFGSRYAHALAGHLTRHTRQTAVETRENPLADTACKQLEEYLQGKRRSFDLPLQLLGTAFQQRVWQQLLEIPYGSTATYGAVAARCGTKGVRAVGSAVGSNPLGIVVPCHRVLAADGRVGNYSGGEGAKTKAFLLVLEGAPVRD